MKMEELKRFRKALEDAMTWEGKRCGPERDPVPPAQQGVFAAAIAISALVQLRNCAEVMQIGPFDIQRAIDAFTKAAQVRVSHTPMGGEFFERVPAKKVVAHG